MLKKELLLSGKGKVVYTMTYLGGWEFQGYGGSNSNQDSLTPLDVDGYQVYCLYNSVGEQTWIEFTANTPFKAVRITNLANNASTVLSRQLSYHSYMSNEVLWDWVGDQKWLTVHLTIEPIY